MYSGNTNNINDIAPSTYINQQAAYELRITTERVLDLGHPPLDELVHDCDRLGLKTHFLDEENI
jgi:hypothetical protein